MQYTYAARANLRRHALTIFVFHLSALLHDLVAPNAGVSLERPSSFQMCNEPSFQTSMTVDNSQASDTFQLALLPFLFLYLLLGIPHCIFEENIIQEGCAVPNTGGILFDILAFFVLFLLI
ncbi:hypothetical protein NXS19_012180 [Fusarium pseudograminearum]|nr:hypothetical protein NXS19_012180 [Fusarium pseudograminearum]